MIKISPDLPGKQKLDQKRYYLYKNRGIIIRTQTDGLKYELERKITTSTLESDSQKIKITKSEFEELSKKAPFFIYRENILIQNKPQIILRIYHNKFEGLKRVEVKFNSIQEAERFIPLDWFGKEITNSPLGRDETLLSLNPKRFKDLINS